MPWIFKTSLSLSPCLCLSLSVSLSVCLSLSLLLYLVFFNTKLSLEEYCRGLWSSRRLWKRETMPDLHRHQQNDSASTWAGAWVMFNFSQRAKSHGCVHQLHLLNKTESWSRIKPRFVCLTAKDLTSRPDWLTSLTNGVCCSYLSPFSKITA